VEQTLLTFTKVEILILSVPQEEEIRDSIRSAVIKAYFLQVINIKFLKSIMKKLILLYLTCLLFSISLILARII